MKLVLSHSTALDLVRAWRCGAPFQLTRTRATSLDNVAHTRTAIERFEVPVFPRGDARTHVLVADAAQLGRSDAHVCHLETQDLPVGALMRVGEDVLAASPALLFVQHAARLPWLQAAMLGAELCGTYSLLPGGERGMRQSVPATSVSALRAFAAKMPRARGAHAAAEALRWVPDAAASPMEAAIYLLLSLPIRRGGYGLPAPLLNPPTALDVRRNRHLPVDELHCDLHWRDAHVALEYNSKDAHVGISRATPAGPTCSRRKASASSR